MNLLSTARIADFFTRPHATITDAQQRRKARLLAALMLMLAGLSLVISALLILRNAGRIQPSVVAVWIGIALILTLYGVNRRGHYQFSAYGFIILSLGLLHCATFVTGDITWLLFSLMILVLSVILLPVYAVFLVYLLSIAMQLVLSTQISLVATVAPITTLTILNVFMLTGALILVYVYHRDGIERDRRAELQAINQKLRDSESALERRVEERTRELQIAKLRAEEALQRAESADHVKMQFLGSMSHELRTPLNSVLNFTEFVQLEMLGPINTQQKDALGKSLESGRHLLSLINDVLDITKIEAGMMKLFLEPKVDMEQLLPSVVESAQTLLRANDNLELVTDIDDHLPCVEGDARRLHQILLKLISNASKFTLRGSITLSAKDRGDHLLFCVSDTGVGIAPEDQQRIFKPFQQIDHTRGYRSGTGVGLAITQWIVNAHGGKLWLESAVGEGASFYFTLPVKQQPMLVAVSRA